MSQAVSSVNTEREAQRIFDWQTPIRTQHVSKYGPQAMDHLRNRRYSDSQRRPNKAPNEDLPHDSTLLTQSDTFVCNFGKQQP